MTPYIIITYSLLIATGAILTFLAMTLAPALRIARHQTKFFETLARQLHEHAQREAAILATTPPPSAVSLAIRNFRQHGGSLSEALAKVRAESEAQTQNADTKPPREDK